MNVEEMFEKLEKCIENELGSENEQTSTGNNENLSINNNESINDVSENSRNEPPLGEQLLMFNNQLSNTEDSIDNSIINITGYVEYISPFKHGRFILMMYFVLNINRKKFKVVVWKNEIQRIQTLLELHNVLYIEGARVKKIKNQKFSINGEKYEFFIHKSTKVTKLGVMVPHI